MCGTTQFLLLYMDIASENMRIEKQVFWIFTNETSNKSVTFVAKNAHPILCKRSRKFYLIFHILVMNYDYI